jgi:CheY-like chemotaxis protein
MLTDLMGGQMTVTSTPGAGSTFKAKLFLPEVRTKQDTTVYSPASKHQSRFFARRPRKGYNGPRRRILVVDNEETDRDLLVNLWQPLGFAVRTAARGHDCLDLMAAGYQPEVILMDLAMPGIDGWETIRRMRVLLADSPYAAPYIAIVSANAFDRGLDNGLGIPSEDFILKPLRHADLLDWLERRLSLTWLEAVAPSADAAALAPTERVYPPRPQVNTLRELVVLGYYRGILNQLDEIALVSPQCAHFVASMRELAKQFQFESMLVQLDSYANEN